MRKSSIEKIELSIDKEKQNRILDLALKYYNITLLLLSFYGLVFILEGLSECTYYINVVMFVTGISYFLIKFITNTPKLNEFYVNWIRMISIFALGDIVYLASLYEKWISFSKNDWENKFFVYFRIFELFFVFLRTIVLFVMFYKFSKMKFSKTGRLFSWDI